MYGTLLFLIVVGVTVAQNAPSAASQDQSLPANDSQVLAVLNQALAVGGGSGAGPQSFSASGSITYYWAGKEVRGSVVVQGRASDQFRLDASLPEGTRSLTVNRGKGTLIVC